MAELVAGIRLRERRIRLAITGKECDVLTCYGVESECLGESFVPKDELGLIDWMDRSSVVKNITEIEVGRLEVPIGCHGDSPFFASSIAQPIPCVALREFW